MTNLRLRHFHFLAAGIGGLSAICEEGRAWYKRADSKTWYELPPLPGIENHLADDADSGPPVSLHDVRALADFMAHTGATPLFDGFDGPTVPPSPDAPPATTKPEFLTYDEPFEDPLQ